MKGFRLPDHACACVLEEHRVFAFLHVRYGCRVWHCVPCGGFVQVDRRVMPGAVHARFRLTTNPQGR